MKKLTKAVLAILVVASSITACKKGEGDPAISLRSRAARVAGEWKVSSQETKSDYSNTSTGSTGNSGSSTEKFTETTYTATNTSGANTSTETGTVADNSWTFEKDGTFKHTMNYTVKKVDDNSSTGFTYITETTTVYSVSEEGVWNFLGNVQADTKNKEEMSVSITKTNNVTTTTSVNTVGFGGTNTVTTTTTTDTETSTDEPNQNVSVWKITTLKNKEMVVEAVGKSTSNHTTVVSGPSGGTTSFTSNSNNSTNMSFTQE